MTPGLAFDEAAHAYFFQGVRVPSVTQILDPLNDFSKADKESLERARQLGTAVHKMIELEVSEELDEGTVTGPLTGFLAQWRDFVTVTGFVPTMCEQKLYSARYGFAGTLDLFGDLSGRKTLIDIKSGQTPKTAALQTAAYVNLGIENSLMPADTRRLVLDLKEDDWKLSKPYTNPRDFNVFLAALTLRNWRDSRAI